MGSQRAMDLAEKNCTLNETKTEATKAEVETYEKNKIRLITECLAMLQV